MIANASQHFFKHYYLPMARPLQRLYIDQDLAIGALISFNKEQTHYIRDVIRLSDGASIIVFNGRDGEWRIDELDVNKNTVQGIAIKKLQEQPPFSGPDIYFAPIKKTGTDFIVIKATELGVRAICPVRTELTNTGRINSERMKSNAREAAEQSGRIDIPDILSPKILSELLKVWPQDRHLIVANETSTGNTPLNAFSYLKTKNCPPAFLIGPEGGFSRSELVLLDSLPFVINVSLGPRILRAETAALGILSCWQAFHGDWA